MSQRGIGIPRFDTLYKLAGEDQPYLIGRTTSVPGSTVNGTVYFDLSNGNVALISKIVITTQGAYVTTSQVNDTTDLLLVDQDQVTRSTLSFLTPHRNPAIFSPVMTQTLPNGNLVWEPTVPLAIPNGWQLKVVTDSTQACEVNVFGWKLPEADARALGYDVTPIGSPTTSHNWFVEGAKPSSDTTTVLVARRAGYALRIDDIVMRMMPATASGTVATVKLQRSDGVSLFEWGANGDNGEPIDKIIRGPFYVDPNDGSALSSTYSPIGTAAALTAGFGLNVTSTNCAGRFTIVVKGAYIPFKDVPDDWWWSCAQPGLPTPAHGLVSPAANLAGNIVATTLKAAPGKGRTLIVEGIDISANKDATVTSSTMCLLIGTGTSADPRHVAIASGPLSYQSQLIPLISQMSLHSHHQRKNITIDRVNMPCGDNKGLFFEAGLYNFLNAVITPTSQTGDFDTLSVTVWGRIRPSKASDQGTLRNVVGAAGTATTGNNGAGLPFTGF